MFLHLSLNNNGYNPIKVNSLQNMEVKSILFFNYTDTNSSLENIKLYLPNVCNIGKKKKITIRENRYMRNTFIGLDLIQLIKLQNIFKDISYKQLGFNSKGQKVEKKFYIKIYLL